MILAPLRGVTIRCFRETFADAIREAGFSEAFTPFIPAMPGLDPLKDRELLPVARDFAAEGESAARAGDGATGTPLKVTPQFIGKDPAALRACLERVRTAGFDTADLNCGCPFPMVRNKGRGSGILRTPDVLRRMLEVGCEVMGAGKFSIKARLGVERNDELLKLMPLINQFPLRFLTVHARNARQMYAGTCDTEMFNAVREVAEIPVVYNGDVPFPPSAAARPLPCADAENLMVGRSFVRALGARDDVGDLLARYIAASQAELCGDRPVLGRMKELIGYWKDQPHWCRRWNVVKMCRSVDELRISIAGLSDCGIV